MLHARLSYFINIRLMLSPYLFLVIPSGLFVSGLPVKILYPFFLTIFNTCPAHPNLIYSIVIITIIIIFKIIVQIMKLLIRQFSPNPCYFHTLRSKHLSRRTILEHSPIFFLPWKLHFHTHIKRQAKL